MARPTWTPSETELKQIETMAALGLTNEQIAVSLGIVPATLYNKKKSNEEFDLAMKRGRAKAIIKAAARIMSEIDDGNLQAAMFFLRTQGGWREKSETNVNVTPGFG